MSTSQHEVTIEVDARAVEVVRWACVAILETLADTFEDTTHKLPDELLDKISAEQVAEIGGVVATMIRYHSEIARRIAHDFRTGGEKCDECGCRHAILERVAMITTIALATAREGALRLDEIQALDSGELTTCN